MKTVVFLPPAHSSVSMASQTRIFPIWLKLLPLYVLIFWRIRLQAVSNSCMILLRLLDLIAKFTRFWEIHIYSHDNESIRVNSNLAKKLVGKSEITGEVAVSVLCPS